MSKGPIAIQFYARKLMNFFQRRPPSGPLIAPIKEGGLDLLLILSREDSCLPSGLAPNCRLQSLDIAIIAKLQHGPLLGKQIAQKLARKFHGKFRKRLSYLKEAGLIDNSPDRTGYEVTASGLELLRNATLATIAKPA